MAVNSGSRVYGSAKTLHTGQGKLIAYLVSHGESTVQAVTFYDAATAAGTVLHKVYVAPEQCPTYFKFGPGAGEPVTFTSGLSVDPGNCDVLVWSVG